MKKLKPFLIQSIIILICFMCKLGYTQMGVQKSKMDDVILFKEKPLLVVLAKDGGKLSNNNFNEYFKKAVNNIWKMSPSFEFVSPESYYSLRDDETKNKNYSYLDFIATGIPNNAPGNSFIVGFPDKRVSPHFSTMYTLDDKYTYGDLFFYLTLVHNDLYDAVNMDRKALKEKRKNTFKHIPLELVSNKTLLLDETLITEDLKSDIKNLYKYDYKIVNKEVIDNAITDRQLNTIIIKKVLSVPRPITKSSVGAVIDGSRHDNGMLKRHPDQIRGTALDAIYFNSLFDTETGKVIFFGYPSFKDKQFDKKQLKIINKVIK